MKIDDWRDKSEDELKKELFALMKEQFNLRMQKSMGGMSRSHLVKQVRRNIARVKTLLKEKESKA